MVRRTKGERQVTASKFPLVRWLVRLCIPFTIAAWATSASAGLTLCNKTPYEIEAAVAYFLADAPGTTTNGHRGGNVHGWYKIAPNECKLVSRAVARNGEFYYRAETIPHGTHVWQGQGQLCVTQRPFDEGQLFLMSGRVCPPGHYAAGFHRAPPASTIEQRVNLVLSD
jgi:uncharacterized membrane protein